MQINTTSTDQQRKFIVTRLEERPHSTNELRLMGIYNPAARVNELRNKGYSIDTVYRQETDSTGLVHRVGVYVLHQNEASQNNE